MTQRYPRAHGAHRGRAVTPPIRGRQPELKLVDELFAAVRAGHGVVVVIEGPPGIGKSRMLAEMGARAKAVGIRALTGKASEFQQSVPFAPLFMATLHADPPVADGDSLRNLGGSADLRYWVLHDLQSAIAAVAAQTPLCIAVDDIQWADAGTVLAIRSLTTGLAGSPVLWALTLRTGAGSPALRDAVSAIADTGAYWLRLGAVEADAVADIVGDALGANANHSLLQIADMAHGNPFLILELLRGLREEKRIHIEQGRASATGRHLPHRLVVAIRQRLDRLSDTTHQLVQVAAILPERFSATLLARMLDRGPAELLGEVTEAIRADLLVEEGDQLRFRHDLLRRATQQSIPRSLRRAMERESATILLEAGAAPEEVATQMARSTDIGDHAAITALRQAARSLARSDPSTAADLGRRALELLPADDASRGEVVAETIALLNQAMRYAEAEHLATVTLSSELSPEEEAKVRLSLSTMPTHLSGWRAEENRRALRLTHLTEATRLRHLGRLAYNLMMDGQLAQARGAAEDALGALTEMDDPQTRLLAEITLANVDCAEGYGRRSLQRLRQLEPLISPGSADAAAQLAGASRADLLITLGLLDEAATVVADGLDSARQQRNAMSTYLFTQLQAFSDLAAGRLSAARQVSDTLPADQRIEWRQNGGHIGLATLSAVAAHTDDRSLMRETGIAARDALAHGGPAARREGIAALARGAWQLGDLEQAARWLGEGTELLGTPLSAVDLDHLILAARVTSTAGDAGLRARVVDAIARLDREQRGMSLFSGVALYARGLLEREVDTLDAAMRILGGCERPLLYAAVAEDVGRELAESGCREPAIERLSTAFDTYSRHEAGADAHRVARVLHRLGVDRRVVRPRSTSGWDSLTAAELKVVDLVADGATNRQVAERLRVSPHTVNTHMRNIFAKLGINSRAKLSEMR
jgi:DNA-binding CsgD family transcriptional regulator